MASAKIAVSLNKETGGRLDRLVGEGVYPSRSRAIQEALEERLDRLSRDRLSRECSKLDPAYESALAEEVSTVGLVQAKPIPTPGPQS